jgi:hypothetical protein
MEVGVRADLGEFKGLDLCHSLARSGDRVFALLILDALNKTKHRHLTPNLQWLTDLHGRPNILQYTKVLVAISLPRRHSSETITTRRLCSSDTTTL